MGLASLSLVQVASENKFQQIACNGIQGHIIGHMQIAISD